MRRDFVITTGTVLAAVLVASFIAFDVRNAGSNQSVAQVSQVGTPVPFTELAHGVESTVTTRTNYLITSSAELSQLWKMIDAGSEVPIVDFTQSDVIAVFAGSEPTAGYAITVTSIEDTAAARSVQVTISKPGVSCLATESLTSPYQVILVPKSALALTHTDQISSISCLQ